MKGKGLTSVQGPKSGVEPKKISPAARNSAPKITGPAFKKAAGGAVGRKGGGFVKGEPPARNAGRDARASGGRTNGSPFSSAHSGTSPKGRTTSGSANK